MKIKKVKPLRVGNSFYFLIPKQYIDNGMIEEGKRYDLDDIKEVEAE